MKLEKIFRLVIRTNTEGVISEFQEATEFLANSFLPEDCLGLFIYCVYTSNLPLRLCIRETLDKYIRKHGIAKAIARLVRVYDIFDDTNSIDRLALDYLRSEVVKYGKSIEQQVYC